MHGSSDDIGWLQRDPEMPPVEDGTERFNSILENIGYKGSLFFIYIIFNITCYIYLKNLLFYFLLPASGMVYTCCQPQWFISWFQVIYRFLDL